MNKEVELWSDEQIAEETCDYLRSAAVETAHEKIYNFLKVQEPTSTFTAQELSYKLSIPEKTITPRINELAKAGYIQICGSKTTLAGRPAKAYGPTIALLNREFNHAQLRAILVQKREGGTVGRLKDQAIDKIGALKKSLSRNASIAIAAGFGDEMALTKVEKLERKMMTAFEERERLKLAKEIISMVNQVLAKIPDAVERYNAAA